jgi:hypothetical protein
MYSAANTPFLPDIDPYVLPRANFEKLIAKYGMNVAWARSHACPCIYGGQQKGSADPTCQTCSGRGIYWDPLSAPFRALITFIHTSPTPDEPGSAMSTEAGLMVNGEPALTIPANAGAVWAEASIYDQFVEIDATARYNAKLQVGGVTSLPYTQNVTVAPTGAVTVWDPIAKTLEHVSNYTVSGATVTISGYPEDTPYMVDFMAAPTYVAYRIAGALPHVRPFGGSSLPRRYRLQLLDLWLRERGAN